MRKGLIIIVVLIGLMSVVNDGDRPCPAPKFHLVNDSGEEIVNFDSTHTAAGVDYWMPERCSEMEYVIDSTEVSIPGITFSGKSVGSTFSEKALWYIAKAKYLKRNGGIVLIRYHRKDNAQRLVSIPIKFNF